MAARHSVALSIWILEATLGNVNAKKNDGVLRGGRKREGVLISFSARVEARGGHDYIA
jgi:hypothetical protein